MLFRTLVKDRFRSLVESIMESTEVIGPKQLGGRNDGRAIHQYLPVAAFDEIDLGYDTTEHSAKTYFLPYRENLSTYRFSDDDWQQELTYRIRPRAIIGLHACDINALVKLDKVFARGHFPSPYFQARRRNTFVVGIDHDPCDGAFCRSLGTDTVTQGFDLYLTDLGDRYFVAVGSDSGFSTLQRAGAEEITDQDTADYLEERRRIASLFTTEVAVHNLPNLLDIEFESEVWQEWGDKCLSCGSCAMVCPTCYCYGVTERVSMDFSTGTKEKKLYACTLLDFAEVAGGHNFRPDRSTRLKYRYYHQHRGFVEAYDEPKCVGCNRCGRTCLPGINPVEVIQNLQDVEEA
jgi:formate hydrogenlyase subunit 6/NADH:ubiquinone oxidoreductase subunit I